VHILFHTPCHLSKGKIESHLAKTLSPTQTKIFNKIITGDETRCFVYDPETKRRSSEWVAEISPRQKKLKYQRSHIKTMSINFFDSQGVVHKEFVPEGKTVNAEFYKGVMDHLLKGITGFVQLRSAFEIFSCCTIMRPPTKLQVFANF
jgi:hypothetical protein